MNWDTVKGDWKQFSDKIKEQWGKHTDDELTQINGNREPTTAEAVLSASASVNDWARNPRRHIPTLGAAGVSCSLG